MRNLSVKEIEAISGMGKCFCKVNIFVPNAKGPSAQEFDTKNLAECKSKCCAKTGSEYVLYRNNGFFGLGSHVTQNFCENTSQESKEIAGLVGNLFQLMSH